MSTRKPCVNFPTCSFTGKEQSPLRYGLSAEGYPINAIMEGHDKHMWAVEVKNNKKVWIRKDECHKVTHEEPLLNDKDIHHPLNIEPRQTQATIPECLESSSNIVEKKTTDYNVFLAYRLKELKEISHGLDNKKIFSKVIEEWKMLKSKPDELNKILIEARKCSIAKPAKPVKPAKPTKSAKPTKPDKLTKHDEDNSTLDNILDANANAVISADANANIVVSSDANAVETSTQLLLPEQSVPTLPTVEKKQKNTKKVNKK